MIYTGHRVYFLTGPVKMYFLYILGLARCHLSIEKVGSNLKVNLHLGRPRYTKYIVCFPHHHNHHQQNQNMVAMTEAAYNWKPSLPKHRPFPNAVQYDAAQCNAT